MSMGKPLAFLAFVEEYVDKLSVGLTPPCEKAGLSPGQNTWLPFYHSDRIGVLAQFRAGRLRPILEGPLSF